MIRSLPLDAMRFAMKRTLLLPLLLTLPLFMSTSLITRADKPAVVADLIIINAKVHTLDPNQPSAEAIAVLANRVVAIGSTKEIRNLAGANPSRKASVLVSLPSGNSRKTSINSSRICDIC